LITCFARVAAWTDGSDTTIRDGDIVDGIEFVLRVNDAAALQQQVKLLCCKGSSEEAEQKWDPEAHAEPYYMGSGALDTLVEHVGWHR
jgi:hypothetical protein